MLSNEHSHATKTEVNFAINCAVLINTSTSHAMLIDFEFDLTLKGSDE